MNSLNKLIPNIILCDEKKLIGLSLVMSLTDNKTGMLWKSFMQKKAEFTHPVRYELYSISVYPHCYFGSFDPAAQFTKWAAMEVTTHDDQLIQLDTLVIPGGLYAVFNYKGSSADNGIFRYIFNTWLPQSGYDLDERPHFEILGPHYKNNDPDSEERIFIPVKLKKMVTG